MAVFKIRDLLVQTANPADLDRIVKSLGAALVEAGGRGHYLLVEGCYVVRCFGDPGFVRFAIEHQGYGKVIGETSPDITGPSIYWGL